MTEAITNALSSCRAAWAAFFAENGLSPDAIKFSDGTPIYAWCLHHEVLTESISEPIENRISYILSDKPEGEQECRFLNLRPVSRESSSLVSSAFTAHKKAGDAAWAEYKKVITPAWAEFKKALALAWDEYQKALALAWDEYQKALALAWDEYNKVLAAFHLADVPHHTWNGTSIFPPKSSIRRSSAVIQE